MPRIRGAILDELRNMDWVPRLVRHRAHQLDQATRALEVELGRMPSDDEIARRLKMSTPQFKKVLKDANATSLISLNRKYTDSEADRDVQELDVISDDQGVDPVTEAQKKDLKLVVTEELSREERLIIVLYYYEEMTMKQIGDTLDLSESRVSQMHSSIVDRLRDKMQDRQREMAAG
jgi:RNA polymerase sigma factor for flagellar operon FliA